MHTRHVISMIGVAAALSMVHPWGPAHAATAIVVDDSDSELSAPAADGSRSATISVYALDTVQLEAVKEGCALEVAPLMVEGGDLVESVEVTVDEACPVDEDEPFEFVLRTTTPGGGAVGDEVDVAFEVATADAGTDWTGLRALPWSVLAALVVTLVVCQVFISRKNTARTVWDGLPDDEKKKSPEPTAASWWSTLPGLASDWSFSDSWASTVTVVSTAAIGLLGAGDVLDAIVGTKPEETTAVLTVGAGISTAIVLVAPIVLAVFRKQQANTVFGVFAGAVLVLGAALGLLGVIWWEMRDVFEGATEAFITAGIALAAIALAVYAVRGLYAILDDGFVRENAPDSDTIKAAAIVAAAITEASFTPTFDLQGLDIKLDANDQREWDLARARAREDARQLGETIAKDLTTTAPPRRTAML